MAEKSVKLSFKPSFKRKTGWYCHISTFKSVSLGNYPKFTTSIDRFSKPKFLPPAVCKISHIDVHTTEYGHKYLIMNKKK